LKICFITLRTNCDYEDRLSQSLIAITSKYIRIVPEQLSNEILNKFDWFFIIGCSGTRPIFDKIRLAEKNIVLVDKGYWAGREIRWRENYWKFAVNCYQPSSYVAKASHRPDRFKAIEPTTHELAATGTKLVFFSGSDKYYRWFNLDRDYYNTSILQRMREYTSKEIVCVAKKGWSTSKVENIRYETADRFYVEHAAALVTHGSAAAISAAALNIPIVILGESPLKCLSQNLMFIDNLKPPHKTKKMQSLYNTAYCQWKFSELHLPEFGRYLKDASLETN